MRVRRIGAVAAVLAVGLSGLAACGKTTDEAARAAGLTPANALGFVTLSLDPSIDQKRNLYEIARRFPDAKARDDFDTSKNELLQQMLKDSGLDYARDVEPWLGSEVALAVLPGPGGEVPVVAVFLEQDDEDKAKAAIDKANQDAVANGETAAEYRMIDDFVVVGANDDPASDRTALDAISAQADSDAAPLADDPKFGDIVDELQSDRLLLAWVDAKESLATLQRHMPDANFDFPAAFNGASTVAFDMHTERSAFVIEAAARATDQAPGGDPKLTKSLPADSLGALSIFDLPKLLRDGLGGLRSRGTDVFGDITRDTGIDVEADILSWVGGEAVLVSAPPPAGRTMPEFGLVIEPRDRAAAEASVARAVASLEQSLEGRFARRQINGATAYLAPEPREGLQPGIAVFADRVVFATTPAYLEKLSKASDPSLGTSPVYESVLGKADTTPTAFQLVLDIDAVREAYERAVPARERGDYDSKARANLEPLDAFGFTTRQDGDLYRLEMKVTFD